MKQNPPKTLDTILQPEQRYVIDTASLLGIDIKPAYHRTATDTCHEKAALLGWPAERVVKILFFSNRSDVYGFVIPELGRPDAPSHIDIKSRLSELTGCYKRYAKGFSNSYCPSGMEYGTCTPFVLSSSFRETEQKGAIRSLFIHDLPSLDSEVVDISIGGFGQEAHRLSLHLSYGGIYHILRHNFGDNVKKVALL